MNGQAWDDEERREMNQQEADKWDGRLSLFCGLVLILMAHLLISDIPDFVIWLSGLLAGAFLARG